MVSTSLVKDAGLPLDSPFTNLEPSMLCGVPLVVEVLPLKDLLLGCSNDALIISPRLLVFKDCSAE